MKKDLVQKLFLLALFIGALYLIGVNSKRTAFLNDGGLKVLESDQSGNGSDDLGYLNTEGDKPLNGETVQGAFSGQKTADMDKLNKSLCHPKQQLSADELLPKDTASEWAKMNPSGSGTLKDKNFLQSAWHVGIDTVGQTLRNANRQLRSDPHIDQVKVSPWLQSTIGPDMSRRSLEIGGC